MSNNEEFPQWEHKRTNLVQIDEDIKNGNQLGKEGWEIAGATGGTVLMKRKARPKPSYNPSYGR